MRSRFLFAAMLGLLAGIQSVAQDGIFVVPPQYAAGGGPLAVAVGDFNGDGKPDLAVSNNYCPAGGCGNSPSTVSILLGKGDRPRPSMDLRGESSRTGRWRLQRRRQSGSGCSKL